MGVVNLKPQAPGLQVPANIQIASEEYKGVVVDSKRIPAAALLTHIEGSSWTVNYYSQVQGKDSELIGQDPSLPAPYQQYKKIIGLEFKVQQGLQSSQDKDNFMMTTGSSMIYPFMRPNKNDMFIADVGDGREGVFQITTCKQNQMFEQSAYLVEYELVYLSGSDLKRRQDLDNKVVSTYHFLENFLLYGENPLVVESSYQAIIDLQNRYKTIIGNYYDMFFDNEYNTFIIPCQQEEIYEPYVTRFMEKISDTFDHLKVKSLKVMNMDEDLYWKQPEIFEVVRRRDIQLLKNSNVTMGLTFTSYFQDDPSFCGIKYAGFGQCVYPNNPRQVLTRNITPKFSTPLIFTEVPIHTSEVQDGVYSNLFQTESELVPFIKEITTDDYYVFSESFYKDTDGKSLLEILVMNYLKNEAIDPVVLFQLVNTIDYWGYIEQFYYTPFILILIKYATRFA